MKRTASAEWKGTLKEGTGVMSSASGTLANVRYGFRDRFEDGPGTNPEELIAAALAACFSMALSGQLGSGGLTPESIRTRANLSFDKQEAGWTVTAIDLDVVAKVPGANDAAFQKAVDEAKRTCPVSRLLKANISASAKLES
jgi:osmotically inducible protein OsmC